MKTIVFFGHRKFVKENELKLKLEGVLKEVASNIDVHFLVGTHGKFDSMAMMSCLNHKKINKAVKITVVLTSLSHLKRDKFGFSDIYYYEMMGCETMLYDIEEVYFKNRIVVSNKMMVDDCDLVICYVDPTKSKSGAGRAVKYAIKRGKPVINLFSEED